MKRRPRASIYRPTTRNLHFLARRIRDGELVAIPTETVYGLAGNALDSTACEKIFEAKGRPSQDPLIVHIYALADLKRIASSNATATKLARKFWPGPLTMVLPKTAAVPDVVTAGRDSVAVRMPAHPIARRLLKLAAMPVAAPSANPFGYISPTTAEHVRHSLGRKIRYILEGGPSSIGLESTIVDLRDPQTPVLLRPGAITKQELEQAIGRRVATRKNRRAHAGHPNEAQLAPGMLTRHYSPRTRVVLHARIPASGQHLPNEAFIFMRKPTRARQPNIFWFDARGDLRGIARSLFATLRRVDSLKFQAIHVELASGEGLADAINDRLRRAAAQ